MADNRPPLFNFRTNMELLPFDLITAKSGEKEIVTSDGYKVTILKWDFDGNYILGVFTDKAGHEHISVCDMYGLPLSDPEVNSGLFLTNHVDVLYTVLFKSEISDFYFYSTCLYETEEAATKGGSQAVPKDYTFYVKRIEIER